MLSLPCARRYGCYLLFQLKTHSQFFNESEDESQPALSLLAALLVLGGITAVVAVCSECAFADCPLPLMPAMLSMAPDNLSMQAMSSVIITTVF